MEDYVNDYLAKHKKPDYPMVPAMFFKRGTGHMSVQASSGHYCSPKTDTGPYSLVEVLVTHPRFKVPKSFGKPSQKFDDGARLYSYVSVSAVNEEIKRRGGLV